MKITLFDLYNQKAQEVINKLSESDKTDVLTARMAGNMGILVIGDHKNEKRILNKQIPGVDNSKF